MTPRAVNWTVLSVFLLSVAVTASSVNVVAQQQGFRWRIDATKTRAYSLSEQTRQMLAGLESEWTIALVMIRGHADRAIRRQTDEVLSRFMSASPSVSVVRIDPTDPRTLGDYEALLGQLRLRYRDLVEEYDASLDIGRAAYAETLLLAERQSGALQQLAQALEVDPATRAVSVQLRQQAQSVALRAEHAPQVLAEMDKTRQVSDAQPIPDYDVARSILAAALTSTANELYEMSEQYAAILDRGEVPGDARGHFRGLRREFEDEARRLAAAADPLNHLPPLELSTIGRQLAQGECAIVLGPAPGGRAAAIPSGQLFPRANFRQTATGVAFDQRFRGEQLIAAAMRSLMIEHMPAVIFVHADERTLMRPRDRHADLTGIANQLLASRFGVREWMVAGAGQGRPDVAPGQRAVYVIVPPVHRQGLEPSRAERALLNVVERLIAEGEPVLLSVYPSVLPRYGQPDPWAKIAAPFGLELDTGRVLYEQVRVAADAVEIEQGQTLQRYSSLHPIGRALDGLQTYLNVPVGIRRHQGTEARRDEGMVIAHAEPSANRWLEPNWLADPATLAAPSPEQRLGEPLPLIVAAERAHPARRGEQRIIVVGTGGWMLSQVADAAVSIGGDRAALLYPGNTELMLASVAWLAGMDDLIAQSPTAQQVARLTEISERAGVIWFWAIVVGMPAAILVLGAAAWGVRRR
jgi:hypothetical protein